MIFADRSEAGKRLAERLGPRDADHTIVLGLPMGGVAVAAEVAEALGLHLDLAVAKKIGHPANPEAAIGAVSEDGEVTLSEGAAERFDPDWLRTEALRLTGRATQIRHSLTGSRSVPPLEGKTVLLVDDGIATGHTMLAAIAWVRRRGAAKVVLAVPVGPPETLARLSPLVDEIVSLTSPSGMASVGAFYADFRQTPETEVQKILRRLS